ncbi:MAG: hypothetical protein ABI634_19275 [Acidobacteriota bacterium]
MMTCKQVSTLLSHGDLASASWSRRLGVRLHLLMCDKCSAFKAGLEAMGTWGRALSRTAEQEAPKDLEARALRRIERSES